MNDFTLFTFKLYTFYTWLLYTNKSVRLPIIQLKIFNIEN